MEEVKLVIDYKCKEWIGTEWAKYLDPETLFGNKFLNKYLPKAKLNPAKPLVERDQFGNVRL